MSDTATESTAGETTAAPPPLTHYHHLGLTVCDPERSESWYRDVLGFERAFVEPHQGGTGYAIVMNRPGTMLFLGLDHHDANGAERFAVHRTGLDHVAIGVERREDLDRWAAHFDRLGVSRAKINEGAVGDHLFATLCFSDPDGIALELIWMQ